jgi:starvation-inducible DNA-binding protein
MEIKIGMKPENSTRVATELNKILADEFLVYVKTRNAHWNVEGADFYSKHKFFEDQYEQLDEIIDNVAERVRAIGHYPVATMKSFLAITHLTEDIREKNDGLGFIKELINNHESIIMNLRGNINRFAAEFQDLGSSDFITGLMEDHEKMVWMLRAHIN